MRPHGNNRGSVNILKAAVVAYASAAVLIAAVSIIQPVLWLAGEGPAAGSREVKVFASAVFGGLPVAWWLIIAFPLVVAVITLATRREIPVVAAVLAFAFVFFLPFLAMGAENAVSPFVELRVDHSGPSVSTPDMTWFVSGSGSALLRDTRGGGKKLYLSHVSKGILEPVIRKVWEGSSGAEAVCPGAPEDGSVFTLTSRRRKLIVRPCDLYAAEFRGFTGMTLEESLDIRMLLLLMQDPLKI